MGEPRILFGVGGIDGSGKSCFARKIIEELERRGTRAALLHVDDFRRPVDWSRRDKPEPDLYYEHYYDLEMLQSCLRRFLAGDASVTIPHYDPAVERFSGEQQISFDSAAVVVVEGVFLLRVPALAASATVWLRTPRGEARRRILQRDTARGRSLFEVVRRIERRYFPSHERYVRDHGPEAQARFVVNNQSFEAPRVVRAAPEWAGSTLAHALLSFVSPCPARQPQSSMRPASMLPGRLYASRG